MVYLGKSISCSPRQYLRIRLDILIIICPSIFPHCLVQAHYHKRSILNQKHSSIPIGPFRSPLEPRVPKQHESEVPPPWVKPLRLTWLKNLKIVNCPEKCPYWKLRFAFHYKQEVQSVVNKPAEWPIPCPTPGHDFRCRHPFWPWCPARYHSEFWPSPGRMGLIMGWKLSDTSDFF